MVRRRPPSSPEQPHRNGLPRGLPGSAIVWSPPRCLTVVPAQWRARHDPVEARVPRVTTRGSGMLFAIAIAPTCHLERVSPRTSRKVPTGSGARFSRRTASVFRGTLRLRDLGGRSARGDMIPVCGRHRRGFNVHRPSGPPPAVQRRPIGVVARRMIEELRPRRWRAGGLLPNRNSRTGTFYREGCPV